MTRFYYGAINPLNVDHFTPREVSEYLSQMRQAQTEAEG